MLLVSREKLLAHTLTGQSEPATSVFCGYDSQEDLAKFGYKLNMKVNFFNMLFIFLATLREPCIEIWRFFFKFFKIMAISKSQKALDFLHISNFK
jgi:hypothetical protein